MRQLITLLGVLAFSISNLTAQQYPDRHNTTKDNSWMSCQATASPVNPGVNSHWIRYDFGTTYTFQKSKIWNLNVLDESDNGMKDINIYHSIDGINWQLWGRYFLPKANETSTYEGVEGPNFDGLVARHIIIEGLSNHGGTCYGISEFRSEATPITLSSDDLANISSVKLNATPNPFQLATTINIESDEIFNRAKYQLTDTKGQLIKSGEFSGNSLTLSGADIPSGIYTLTLISDQKRATILLTHID